MGVFITILLSAAATGFWYLRKHSPQPVAPSPARTPYTSNPFAGVALRCSSSACGAALRLRNRKILAVDAPPLPLPNCDRKSCACCYRKLADRRQSEGRRTVDLGIRPLMFDGRELRVRAPDRRAD